MRLKQLTAQPIHLLPWMSSALGRLFLLTIRQGFMFPALQTRHPTWMPDRLPLDYTDAFRGQRMTEEIRIKNAFASNKDRINYALKLRKELIRSKPITHEQISRLDQWLVAQPETPIAALLQIWTRIMWVSACEYEQEKDPLVKHFTLLGLREHFETYLGYSERLQEAMAPHWLTWLDVLQSEEQKLEKANGSA